MRKNIRSRAEKAGNLPGTLVHLGEQKMEQALVMAVDYNESHYSKRQIGDVADLTMVKDVQTHTWVTVAGLHDVAVIEAIGQFFGIHPLLLEDILNTDQRPKLEQYDDYVYLILKALTLGENGRIQPEQISIVLGKTFVLTFEEQEDDTFQALRQRLENEQSRLRRQGVDYLAYSLLDVVVDNYFVILENLGDRIEDLEDDLITNANRDTLEEIQHLKRELLYLRRTVWPLREVIGALQRGESDLFDQGTLIYLRDVYEHTIQVIDTLETYRDIVSGLLDIYLSGLSNKLNEVMKVLTVISTIFIPITFVTSLYGMNFAYMPELHWRWGYWTVWGVVLITAVSMILFFRHKKWL
ncbi:MAG: magnesium/cobalt transporter CorA [Ardenticatenaceae bacterium]|nr:magnesium/cobalt transporter CorA [Ardenticatenaceae bacterium]MCB9446433.1 magnesium/cobalt transporter CorA [Ardenticatenaceae bacterium]